MHDTVGSKDTDQYRKRYRLRTTIPHICVCAWMVARKSHFHVHLHVPLLCFVRAAVAAVLSNADEHRFAY